MPLTKIIFYLMTVNSCFATTNFIFTYENEFRLKNQNNPLYYDHNDIQIKYLISPYVDIFSDYRLIFQNKGTGWTDQNMLLEGFNLKLPKQQWGKLNLRNRLEIGFNPSPTPTTWQLNEFPKYYYCESAQGNPWTHANVLVTQIKFIF